MPPVLIELLHHATTLYHSMTHLYGTAQDARDYAAESVFRRAIETVEHLRLKLPEELASPRVAVVCGSGLGGLAGIVNRGDAAGNDVVEFDYKDVPNFPVSTGKSSEK